MSQFRWIKRRCGWCGGSGVEWSRATYDDPRPTCGNCRGTGEVKEIDARSIDTRGTALAEAEGVV